jgi:7-keto-8-aminopelargonate synthetase-like enzyme
MKQAYEIFRKELDNIRDAGTFKDERIITTPQKSRIDTTNTSGVLNMCANNYLGLSNHPALIEAAKASYDVKVGDHISIAFGARTVTVEVLAVAEAVRKDDATAMYREM